MSDLELVTVLRPNNPALRALAESILKDAGIPFFIRGDQAFQNLYTIGQVELQVFQDHEEDARELLSRL